VLVSAAATDAPRVYPGLALTLGVVSLAGCLFGVIPLVAGVAGIVLGARASKVPEHKTVATAALIVSALGVAAGAGFLLMATVAVLLL
jgi:hypothetical protein